MGTNRKKVFVFIECLYSYEENITSFKLFFVFGSSGLIVFTHLFTNLYVVPPGNNVISHQYQCILNTVIMSVVSVVCCQVEVYATS